MFAGGDRVGTVTSGNFSPVLGRGIAMALVDTAAGLDIGATAEVDVRGRALPVTVAALPFVRPGEAGRH